MIISFAGHASVPYDNKIKELVKTQIRNNIMNCESVVCYLGGYGNFDEICAQACRELRQEYSCIQVVYVTPYITLSEQEKIKTFQNYGLYDTSIYPPIEHVPPKFAISKRNEWMMSKADLVIAYINHNYGGAYKSIQTAKRKKKKTINIFDFL